ncbi:MAG: tetratricopeptide repeat protein [Candidatus Tectomicrobia bacterium]|uniref:Tetratricopeptide repeat protein n=1 Tax=Tectimicrobiota bacterium TaxID=2528274 RepID=A0A932CMV7_UNCTE|nr:tetratricopeptide repeat protein [Candidatus Tectomicrobia bacterium]
MSRKEIKRPEERGSLGILWGLGLSLALSTLVAGHLWEGTHAYLQLLLLLLLASHLIQRFRAPREEGHPLLPPLAPLYPLGALLVLGLLSLAHTVNYALTVRHFHQWIGYGILAYLVAYQVRPPGQKALIQLLVGLGGILALYGIYQHFWGFPHTLAYLENTGEEPLLWGAFRSGRVFSTFFSPDMLAGYLAMVIPLGLTLLGGRSRPWATVSLGLMLAALYLTGSLGGGLSLLAALGLWGVLGLHRGVPSPEQRRPYRVGLLALLLGGMLLMGMVLWARSPHFLQLSHPDNSLVQRWHYWESAVRIAADFPLSGSGWGTFGLLYPQYKPAMANETQYVHNSYLQLAAELGLPGLAAFLWAALLFLRRGWRAISPPATREAQLMAWGLLAGGTAFLLHSLVDYGLSTPQVALSWWTIFGLMVAPEDPAGHRPPTAPRGAIGRRRDLLGLDPDRVARALQAALLLALLGLALSISKELLGRHYYQEAREAVQKKQLGEADLAIRRALSLDPLNDAYYYFSARLSADRMQQARQLSPDLIGQTVQGYGRAIELNPYYSFYRRDRGLFFLGLGQGERAVRDLAAAVALYPTHGSHHHDLGLAYRGRGDLRRAEAEFREALRLQPGHRRALRELAWTLFAQRRIDAALPYFEQLVRLHPREAQARVDLGWAYAGLGWHQRALQEYEAVLRQDPRHIYAWVNQGWSLYQLNEYARAEAAYRKALSLDPNALDARVNLVLLYLKTREEEKARAELARALQIAPQDPRLLRLQQELAATPGNHRDKGGTG